MRRLIAALAAATFLIACTDDEPEADPSTSTETSAPDGSTSSTEPLPEPMLDSIELDVQEIAELDEPIALAVRPGSPDLYIAEKGGRVRLIKVEEEQFGEDEGELSYELQDTPLLDISDRVSNSNERGLLGMAFSSDGRKVYLDYTRQPDGHTLVVEYTLGDSTRIDEDSRREILFVEQPFPNHNGGELAIGPDGYLYVSLGDGGSAGDPEGHGQDTTTLLGSILRIDPEGGSEDGPAYAIPPGNPFAGGDDGAPEIWLYGARNPWRFSFDRGTGDLWVADVGQDEYEEINWLPAEGGFDAGKGDNLGWSYMEGTHQYHGRNPEGAVLPIFEYGRDAGCSVIGGYVYRGEDIAGLEGTYLYADYCGTGLSGLQVQAGTVIDSRTWDLPLEGLFSLGQDESGEIYALAGTGQVVKIGPPNTDDAAAEE